MIYLAYQSQADIMQPVRMLATSALSAMNGSLNGSLSSFAAQPLRNLAAAYEMLSRAGISHARPPFGIDKVMVGNREVAVTEEPAHVTPFGTLLHFKKDVDMAQPRVMVVAPLSGHFATLLRETVRTLLPENDVYITDWHNARDVPASTTRSST
jgi:poly(3-hydroxybutyrate) depolymerase